MELTYVFHEPDGTVHAELDAHVCGIFPTATWTGLLADVGFVDAESVGLTGDELRVGTIAFVGTRAA